LTRPKGHEGTKGIACLGLGPPHLLDSSPERDRECTGWAGLDFDLCHLKRTQGDVGKDLGGGRAKEPDSGLVFLGCFLSGHVHIQILEHFVETIFEHALQGVPNESRSKAFPDALCAFFLDEQAETRAEASVFFGVDLRINEYGSDRGQLNTDLHVTFCDIQRGYSCVGGTASQYTAEHAFCVV
jgi:hypothetical protein